MSDRKLVFSVAKPVALIDAESEVDEGLTDSLQFDIDAEPSKKSKIKLNWSFAEIYLKVGFRYLWKTICLLFRRGD